MQNLFPKPRGGHNYRHGGSDGPWLFYWDVKLHGLNLEFQNLLDVAVSIDCVDPNNQDAINHALDGYGNIEVRQLEEWATADACRDFYNEKGVPDDHGLTSLWSGDDIGAEYSLMGSGSGWLVMTGILGYTLDTELYLDGLSYRQIRAISEMVWYVTSRINNRGPQRAVEERAAWILFRNFE
jgi:hypothetical protein